MIACTAVLSPIRAYTQVPIDNLASRAAAPIYFDRSANGTAITYDYMPADETRKVLAHVASRVVTAPEISALQKAGYTVAFLNSNGTKAAGTGSDLIERESIDIAGDREKISDGATQLGSLPSSFTIMESNGVIYGNFYVAGTRPAGTTTQWAAYDVTTSGYPQGSHTAVGLLMDTTIIQQAAVGSGMIFGAVGVNLGNGWAGCAGAGYPGYDSQIEAFWQAGNWLFPDSCFPAGWTDGYSHSYSVALQANTASWVAYSITDHYTGQHWNSPAEYTNSVRPANQQITPATAKAGIIFAAVFPGPNDFWVRFSNVGSGWF